MQETRVQSLGWEGPLEKEMATQYSCLGNPIDRGILQATVLGVRHDLVTKPTTNNVLSDLYLLLKSVIITLAE